MENAFDDIKKSFVTLLPNEYFIKHTLSFNYNKLFLL